MAAMGYVTLGTSDVEKATAFYDTLFETIGHTRVFQDEHGFIGWGTALGEPMVAITPPFNGEPATVGNGVMVAINMESREQVDAFHAKALSLGSADEGAPGERIAGCCAAYFRDLDGNKLAAFAIG